jgi:hypothetical protein
VSSKFSLSLRFPTKALCAFLYHPTRPAHPILRKFISRIVWLGKFFLNKEQQIIQFLQYIYAKQQLLYLVTQFVDDGMNTFVRLVEGPALTTVMLHGALLYIHYELGTTPNVIPPAAC